MKTIDIFISSTFKDMDAERDLVVSVLKPAVESALSQRHINALVRIVDLRWGVNTQDVPEEQRENKVLNECLDYIRTSKPFFIGFIGERYGWVPPAEQWNRIVESMSDEERLMMGDDVNDVRSVTELEMLFGVLNDRNALESSFFFLRTPDVYQQMDPVVKSVFCDKDPVSHNRLDKLRHKIRETYNECGYTGNVIDYDCEWDGASLIIDENIIKGIVEPLVRSIMSNIEIDETEQTEIDDIIGNDKTLIEEKCSYYIPDSDLLNTIIEHLGSSVSPIVIQAEDGMGKSSLLAYLYNLFSGDDNWLPMIHFSSKNGHESFCEVMLRKFLWQLPIDGCPKFPLSVESHPGLLMKYQISAADMLDKRILLLIDNVQYLKSLDKILSDLVQTDKVSVILTSNVHIDFLQDGSNAHYIELPDMTRDVTLSVIAKYMESSHKSLPVKVVTSILNKKTDDGKFAIHSPLWTILLLNHLLCLDLNDFAKIRNIAGVDEAEKISMYLQLIIDRAPSDVSQMPEYIAKSFDLEQERLVADLFLNEIRLGYTTLDRLRERFVGSLPLMTYQKIKKAFSPLLTVEYQAGVAKLDSDILESGVKEPCRDVPADEMGLWNYLFGRSIRLVQVLNLLSECGTEQACDVIGCELNYSVAFFSQEIMTEIQTAAKSAEWSELSMIFKDKSPVQAFVTCLSRYRQEPSGNNILLLSVAYWHLNSQSQFFLENVNDRNTYSQVLYNLDRAFNEMNVIPLTSLIAVLANGLYFGVKANFEKRFCRNLTDAIHYYALQEQSAWILYRNNHGSYALTYNYAARLDENSAYWLERGSSSNQQQRYMSTGLAKNGLSIGLFEDLYKVNPSDELKLDIAMAKVRKSSLLMDIDNDAAIEWNEHLIDQLLLDIAIPGITRQLAFACDYQARVLIRQGKTLQASDSITKAIDILRSEHCAHPDDVMVLHSLTTVLKTRADVSAHSHTLSKEDVNEIQHYAFKALEANPNDSVALSHLLMSLVLDMYCHAENKDSEGLFELAQQTLQLMGSVLPTGNNIRCLELQYFIPGLDYVLRTIQKPQAIHIAEMYSALRSELMNRRLVSQNYLPSLC